MLVRFKTNLGRLEAESLNKATGATIDFRKCTLGEEVEIQDEAAEMLVKKNRADAADRKVRGVAKSPELTGPAK